MYKHTVKSKLSQVRSNPPQATATPISNGNHRQMHGLGAGKKFFSHIRHKIEDNLTPRLSGKLYYKGSKHTRSMSALSLVDTNGCVDGKYTPKVPMSLTPTTAKTTPAISSSMQMTSSSICSYVDSDDDLESQLSLSLNLAQQSLEDEIFAELEKVAHDESKLNEVLQSFDQILSEYPPPVTSTVEEMPMAMVTSVPPPPPPVEFSDDKQQQQLLSKSFSSLSITGRGKRQIYQTPELANSMLLIRRSNSTSRYSSLCELNAPSSLNGSRIPIAISKHSSSLRKSSESFYLEQPKDTNKKRTRSLLILNTSNVMASAIKPKPKRANSTLEKPPRRSNTSLNRVNSRNCQTSTKTPNANANSDELLVKCLAKGHEILRKVENLNTSKPAQRRATRGIHKEHSQVLKSKKKLQKLQYANEEKVRKPKLESCKIIPPKLGETSDKNQELLVQVKVAERVRPVKQKQVDVDQEEHNDSDDSGHISNTVLSISTSTTNSTGSLCESEGEDMSNKMPKSNKIKELLEKFEAKALNGNPTPNLSAMATTTTKVAQVQAVRCIHTQVEIYPTYTKEVTIRLS
ncbi:uncharacterized protein Dwil_GK14015 [Drosophila willistoni]|uniref:Uncharacterized protein n=1 Tax=Drosophila willistoni TaxID=7260 RepID=B4NL13_DROWI|nr:uncharacterized protein LOC6651067 [Drosophila willistoni]EDW84216.1 uncharacterized protein Dwil_GK14015 [Drosophila willistoni]